MSTIVVDAALKDKLLAAGPGAEMRDEDGNLLGEFTPVVEVWDQSGNLVGRFPSSEGPAKYVMEGQFSSDEELDRREREEPSYSAEQVQERLRRLRDAR
jgi:hypothetical protein